MCRYENIFIDPCACGRNMVVTVSGLIGVFFYIRIKVKRMGVYRNGQEVRLIRWRNCQFSRYIHLTCRGVGGSVSKFDDIFFLSLTWAEKRSVLRDLVLNPRL